MSESSKPRRGSRAWVDEPGLAQLLRALREHHGLRQQDVAARAGLSPASIARIESEDRRPSHDVLRRLAAVFGLEPEQVRAAARRHTDSGRQDVVLASIFDSTQLLAMEEGAGQHVRSYEATSPSTGHRDGHDEAEARLHAAAARLARTVDPHAALDLITDLATWIASRQSEQDLDALRAVLADILHTSGEDLAAHNEAKRFLATTATRELNPQQRERLLQRLAEDVQHSEDDRPRVATMDTGRIWHVFANAIGQDERGDLWIDPQARAYPHGYAQQDPRVERYDNGRIVLDLSGLPSDTTFVPRVPAVHRTRTTVLGKTQADDLDQAYATTILEIDWQDGTRTTIEPRPPGQIEGDFPSGVDHVHVLTAWNPRSRLLDQAVNDERNRYLARQLDDAGMSYRPAVGRSPAGSWHEDSFAVLDADVDQLLDLATDNEQNAIFEWTRDHLIVLWTSHQEDPQPPGWRAQTPA